MIRAVGYEKAKHGEVERIALINESRGMSTSETRLICLINDARPQRWVWRRNLLRRLS